MAKITFFLAAVTCADLIGYNRMANNIGSYRIYRANTVEAFGAKNTASSKTDEKLLKILNEHPGPQRSLKRFSARKISRQLQRKELYYRKFRLTSGQ